MDFGLCFWIEDVVYCIPFQTSELNGKREKRTDFHGPPPHCYAADFKDM